MSGKNEKTEKGGLAKLRSGRVLEILLVLIAAVIVAIVLYNVLAGGKDDEEPAAADYATQLEARLGEVLSGIDGAGNVSVMIQFSDDGEKIIAMETTTLEDGTVVTAPVLIDGDVVVLEEKKPEISGVLIVAEGADSLSVRFDLLSAAASVLDINQSLIKVYTKA